MAAPLMTAPSGASGRAALLSWLPLVVLAAAYTVTTVVTWSVPVTSDSLAFCSHAVLPAKETYVFERYWAFYSLKILTAAFDDRVAACGAVSIGQILMVMTVAYGFVRAAAGPLAGATAAALVMVWPPAVFEATEYSTDVTALAWGLAALWAARGAAASRSRTVAAGFCVGAALGSKVFAIAFVPALIVLVWPQPVRQWLLIAAGGLLVLLTVAVGDAIWIGDPLYHLAPANYQAYAALIQEKLEQLRTVTLPAHVPTVGGFLRIPTFLFTLALGGAALSLWTAEAASGRAHASGRRAVVSLLIVGFGVWLMLAQTYVSYSGHAVQWNYFYGVAVPWMMAFAIAVVGGLYASPDRFGAALAFAVACVAAAALAWALAGRTDETGVTGRLMSLVSFALLALAAAAFGAAAGYIGRGDHGARRRGVTVALASSALIVAFAVELPAARPALVTGARAESALLRQSFHDLLGRAPVVPYRCGAVRLKEAALILMLGGQLADEDLMFSGFIPGYDRAIAEFFEPDGAAIRLIRDHPNGFFVWTNLERAALAADAGSAGLVSSPLDRPAAFGCAFVWISPRSIGSLGDWYRMAMPGRVAADAAAYDALAQIAAAGTLVRIDPSVSPTELSSVTERPLYAWFDRSGGEAALRIVPANAIEAALLASAASTVLVTIDNVALWTHLTRASWATLQVTVGGAGVFAIDLPAMASYQQKGAEAALHVRSGDGTLGMFPLEAGLREFRLEGAGASEADNIRFHLDRPGAFLLDDVVFRTRTGPNLLSPADAQFEAAGGWAASGTYSIAYVPSGSSGRMLRAEGREAGSGGSAVTLTVAFFAYAGGPTVMTFRAGLEEVPVCTPQGFAADFRAWAPAAPREADALRVALSRLGVHDYEVLSSTCVLPSRAMAGTAARDTPAP